MIKTVIVNDTAHANHHGCLRVMRNLRQALDSARYDIIGSIPVGVPFERESRNRELVDAAELVIINGEGSIHHDRPYSKSLVGAIEYARGKNKKVALINALWQENSISLAKAAGLSDLIYVRDRRSQDELIAHGVKAEYAPDMTFLDPVHSSNKAVVGTVAITDSVFKDHTLDIYRYCLQHEHVSYAPMVRSRLELGRNKEDGLKVAKERLYLMLLRLSGGRLPVRQYYKNLLFQRRTPEDYTDYLAVHEAVVCYRFHALCFCIQAGIPFLAVRSNSWKVEALLEEIGLSLSERLLTHGDIMSMSPDEIIDKARFTVNEREIIDGFIGDARNSNLKIFNDIDEISSTV